MKPTLKDLKKTLQAQDGFEYPYQEEVTEDTLSELSNNKGDDDDE